MEKNLYVIYDNVAQESGNVFTSKNDQVAIRQTVNTIRENTYMNPKEYKLYQIATYNPETLELTLCKKELDFISSIPIIQSDIQRAMFENALPKLKEVKHA